VDSFISAIRYPHVRHVEIVATMRSNKSLEPTAGRRDAHI
jgi:hypothetical protein